MTAKRYILGLDVGVASIGWAVILLDAAGRARGLVASGVVLFEPGTDGGMKKIGEGQDTPRNKERRDARSMRRQTWRRAKRKRALLRTLIRHGMLPLPAGGAALRRPADIDAYLKSLDAGIIDKWAPDHTARQTWPYHLRASAAGGGEMSVFEVGRALYHLAQRRGFLSNRRTDIKPKAGEDKSVVKRDIADLQSAIDAMSSEPRTLGAYLATLDPDQQRLRGRWTARSMYAHEFDTIWATQCARHAVMTEVARVDIHTAVFFQRPLRDQSHLIGRCSLLPSERRCPLAVREYQRFRVLQSVNAMQVSVAGEPIRPLSPEERAALAQTLIHSGDLTFARIRTLLRLPRAAEFNMEAGQTGKLIGHRTDAKLRHAFGERFDALADEDKDRVVHTVRSFRSQSALAKALETTWQLDPAKAAWLAEPANGFEEARGSISLKAVRRLLPFMAQGQTYAEARKQAGFASDARDATPLDRLPPVIPVSRSERSESSPLRNPSVVRALTEVRKLVNAVLVRYGKPEIIRVELARDLKRPRGEREAVTSRNSARAKQRAGLEARIIKEGGVSRPSREDIEKALLFEECGGICPYTGRSIDFGSMFGKHPQVDIEHVWPRSRCLDDSFLNKTLCFADENRGRKGGRTPFEAYGGGSQKDDERFNQMLDRVQRFRGDPFVRTEKFRRFQATQIDAGFENRHLSDTRFISKACADYLALLYGGNTQMRIDEDGTRRVQTPTGGLTAWLRSGWGLSRLLGDTAEKNRGDHRHHAIDAMVIALSDHAAVKRLSEAASRAEKVRKRHAFDDVGEPFAGFREQAKGLIDAMIVAHRQSRKITGALHTKTVYSQPIRRPDGTADGKTEHRVRKVLAKLSPTEIKKGHIVDKQALAAIRAKLAELGMAEPDEGTIKQTFSNPENLPLVRGFGGKMVRLRKVRVLERKHPVPLGGKGKHASPVKHILTEGNHHTIIVESKDAKGRTVWTDHPLTLVAAVERLNGKRPVVCRDVGPDRKFICSLAPNDYLQADSPRGDGGRRLYRVSNLSEGQNELRLHNDARMASDLRGRRAEGRKDERVIVDGEKLRKLNARKVRVTYLGEVLPAND